MRPRRLEDVVGQDELLRLNARDLVAPEWLDVVDQHALRKLEGLEREVVAVGGVPCCRKVVIDALTASPPGLAITSLSG